MGALAITGIIYIIYKLIAEACETPYKVGSIDNHVKFSQDITKVTIGEMTNKQLDKNIRNGVYRK